MKLHGVSLVLIWGEKQGGTNHWDHQVLFTPHKPINQWLNIEVIRIMTKACTIGAVAIYTSLQPIIHQFMIPHKKT